MLARKTSCISTASASCAPRNCKTRKLQARSGFSRHSSFDGTGVFGLPHVTNCSWSGTSQKTGKAQKQFLADLIDNSKAIYEKSRGCNFPLYQKTVPDLIVRLENERYRRSSF